MSFCPGGPFGETAAKEGRWERVYVPESNMPTVLPAMGRNCIYNSGRNCID